MPILPTEVTRDEDGFFWHPDLPQWDENEPKKAILSWGESNRIIMHIVMMDGDADEELVERWFDGEISSCIDWTPTPPSDLSFLLAIYDTEDAPYALFATPTS